MPSAEWVTVAHPTWVTMLMLLSVAGSVWVAWRTKQWGTTVTLAGVAIGVLAPALWVGVVGLVVMLVGLGLAARDARRAR